jgi:hypothetical protein
MRSILPPTLSSWKAQTSVGPAHTDCHVIHADMSLKIGDGNEAIPVIVAVAGDTVHDMFVINGVNLETKVIKNIHQCTIA